MYRREPITSGALERLCPATSPILAAAVAAEEEEGKKSKNQRREGEEKGGSEVSMKNPYAKGKVRIYPHIPSEDLAVLALLPAGVFAMTAVLSDGDKVVLAYLVTRSLVGTDADKQWLCRTSRQLHGPPGVGGAHRPMFDCGCFECYTSFWIRWDSSPDRELIHQVIEAFEEHLAASEKKGKGGRRRRERKEKGRRKGKTKGVDVVAEEEEKKVVSALKEGREVVEAVEEGRVSSTVEKDEMVGADEGHEPSELAVGGDAGDGGCSGERRTSWPDVMGLFCSRLWNIWSPST